MSNQLEFPLLSINCSNLADKFRLVEDVLKFKNLRKVIYDRSNDFGKARVDEYFRTETCLNCSDSLAIAPSLLPPGENVLFNFENDVD